MVVTVTITYLHVNNPQGCTCTFHYIFFIDISRAQTHLLRSPTRTSGTNLCAGATSGCPRLTPPLIHTCLRNLGLTWMLELGVGGGSLMGHAGSTELTFTSSAYSFLGGNTSSQVERSLNRDFLVFSSTYKQRTALGPQPPTKSRHHTVHSC